MTEADLELPGILGELTDSHGVSPALALARWLGGRRLYVPERYVAGHEIERRLGRHAFRWLIQKYPRETVEVPRVRKLVQAMRDRAIAEEHEAGRSISELAAKHELTMRGVTLAIQRARERGYDPQFDLFASSS